jgi:hypothetical protein
LVLVQFEDTPKAFANFSPGLELATTLGHTREKNSTLKALADRVSERFQRWVGLVPEPRVEATLG